MLAAPGALVGPGAFNGGGYYNRGAFHNSGGYNPAYDGGFNPYPPQYSFDYRVAEPRTGDYKNHQESRNGDAVRGQYSVAEPDGSLLTVNYAADDAHGYTAQVTRSGAGGAVVHSFPGPAPLPVGHGTGGYVAPSAVPLATPAATVHHGVGAHFAAGAHGAYSGGYSGGYNGGYNGGYSGGYNGYNSGFSSPYHRGFGTSSTSFHGPHAAYSYTN